LYQGQLDGAGCVQTPPVSAGLAQVCEALRQISPIGQVSVEQSEPARSLGTERALYGSPA
jgi:hypothetical protein